MKFIPTSKIIMSSTPRLEIPEEVATECASGVEDGSLKLARLFLSSQGQLARKCYKRGELSYLYISTFAFWAPKEVANDKSKQRPFKQILFALAHGLKVVRVVNSGRKLLWNRFRDDQGNQIEARHNSGRGRRGGRHRDGDRRSYDSHTTHSDDDEYSDDEGYQVPSRNYHTGNRRGRHRQDRTSRYERRKPRLCYNCDKPGHIARECDQPKRKEVVVTQVNLAALATVAPAVKETVVSTNDN